ncbi:MAG: ORF6N domain-containing protein [Bryobacteraceae bacterium]
MPKAPSSPAGRLPVPLETIERRIYVIRGQKVMLDSDLAELYQVPTKRLNEAVRRNGNRFPEDFMLQLTAEEAAALRSQIATLDTGRGRYSKYAPLAFTEHGVAMLSSVLNNERAAQMNILIIRAFVKLRELLASNKEMARKIEELEDAQKRTARTQQQHGSILVGVINDIQRLKNPPITRAIGFVYRSPKKK